MISKPSARSGYEVCDKNLLVSLVLFKTSQMIIVFDLRILFFMEFIELSFYPKKILINQFKNSPIATSKT